MAETYKLSLFSAIIINLNIMMGVGVFLNGVTFAQKAGAFGFAPYLIVGILFVPLIIAMAVLLNKQPDGTFYGVAHRELGKFWGFLSTWAYFIAKPASAGVMITFFCNLILVPLLKLPLLTCTVIVLVLFVLLNLLGMSIGRSIQMGFIVLKSIPILFIIFAGLWYLNPVNFVNVSVPTAGTLISIFSLAIYSFAGFEASFSLNKHIENPQKNAPRAIIISYLIVIGMYLLYQTLYYGALNLSSLMSIKDECQGTYLFLSSIYQAVHPHLQAFFYLCIGTSAFGGAYGILFSNIWNLHGLAEKKHVPFAGVLTTKNKAGIAYWCLLIETVMCVTYIFATHADKIILRQINAFGCTLTYTISALAFVVLAFTLIKTWWAQVLSILALCSCTIFIYSCVDGFRVYGPNALYAFVGLLVFGALLFAMQARQKAA